MRIEKNLQDKRIKEESQTNDAPETRNDRDECGSAQGEGQKPFEEGKRRQTMKRMANPMATGAKAKGDQKKDILSRNRPAKMDEFAHNPNKADPPKESQNGPGEEMNESRDESVRHYRRQSNARADNQKFQNKPRSRRQLGDPDDEVSAETRRKESAAEDAERSGMMG